MPGGPAKKVLIIEEDPHYRTLLQQFLEGLNYILVGVESGGDEAIDLFERKKPDVVLLNISTPLELGLEVLKGIKKIDPNAKVIMITNVMAEGTVKRCIGAGAYGYILKEDTNTEIKRRLANLLDP